jgi:hypothetical protein
VVAKGAVRLYFTCQSASPEVYLPLFSSARRVLRQCLKIGFEPAEDAAERLLGQLIPMRR